MDRKALLTVGGAIVLTIATATSAVALNLGILDAPAADKVGELHTTPSADAQTTTNATGIDPVTDTVASHDRSTPKTSPDGHEVSTTVAKASLPAASTTSKPKIAPHLEAPKPTEVADSPVAPTASTTTERPFDRAGHDSGAVKPPQTVGHPGAPDDGAHHKGHDDDD